VLGAGPPSSLRCVGAEPVLAMGASARVRPPWDDGLDIPLPWREQMREATEAGYECQLPGRAQMQADDLAGLRMLSRTGEDGALLAAIAQNHEGPGCSQPPPSFRQMGRPPRPSVRREGL